MSDKAKADPHTTTQLWMGYWALLIMAGQAEGWWALGYMLLAAVFFVGGLINDRACNKQKEGEE